MSEPPPNNGRFQPGCKPGPGRPKKAHAICDPQLVELAQPWGPGTIYLNAMVLRDHQAELIDVVNDFAPEIAEHIHNAVLLTSLAQATLIKRLRNELSKGGT